MSLRALLFDLDGVLISTHQLHYESWAMLTQEEGIPFDWEVNRRLLGVSRAESLEIVLERSPRTYSEAEKQELCDRKNRYYLEMVRGLTTADLLPGALDLLQACRGAGLRSAICSGSRNAGRIVEQLGLGHLFDVVVDGNHIQRTKPDPEVFLLAAERLDVAPEECLVLEDAEVGIAAARNAGMRVLGVGDPAVLGAADRVVGSLAEVTLADLEAMFPAEGEG
jgi:beta-phosphoglucomutase